MLIAGGFKYLIYRFLYIFVFCYDNRNANKITNLQYEKITRNQ